MKLSNYVFALAVAGLLTAILETLTPEGRTKKAIGAAASLFICICVLSPLVSALTGAQEIKLNTVGEPAAANEAHADYYNETMLAEIEAGLVNSVGELLRGIGSGAQVRKVLFVSDENGNISVTRIILSNNGGQEDGAADYLGTVFSDCAVEYED